MKRYQFDRIIRSYANVTGKADVLVIGSQAILGLYGDIDNEIITRSPELDVSDLHSDDSHIHEVAGVLGELSDFQESNDGAYADSVVAEEVAQLPSGWRDRLVKVETPTMITPKGIQARAFCLHPNDVIVSKYLAGREKDYEYCDSLLKLRYPEIERQQIEAGIRDIISREPSKEALGRIALAKIARIYEELEEEANDT